MIDYFLVFFGVTIHKKYKWMVLTYIYKRNIFQRIKIIDSVKIQGVSNRFSRLLDWFKVYLVLF
jgi:hypothetical protein